MTLIFSNVVANIDRELESKFPSDFDFYAMIQRVSEDAGVKVQTRNEPGKKLVALQGVWISMERVHNLLATALAVYGSRVTTVNIVGESPSKNVNDENKHKLSEQSFSKININGGQTTLITKSFSDETPSLDFNKSQLKRHTEHTKNSESDLLFNNRSKTTLNNTNGVDSESDESHQNISEKELSDEQFVEEYQESGNDSSDYEYCKKTDKKGRGRPRKNNSRTTSQRACTKICTKYGHRGKRTKLKSGFNEGGVKMNRGRGRPRKFPDGEPKEFQCPDCDFVAKSRNTLGDHKHRVHLANPTKCDICLKVFPNTRYMRRHRTSHIEPQHCCDVCGKMYKIRKAMLDHKKTHEEGYSKPSFPCDMCSKSFCSNYILACHVKSEHLGQKKSFLCSICGKSFTTKHSLQEHSNAHTGAKPHICEVCGKGFCYESALRDHKFVHITSKQFICEVCSKGFSQRSGLKMHMRIHESNKQFVCSDCGREFTQKQALQRHERVHKGDKPFICKLCAKTFSDASIIRRHMILVHKIHKDANTWREDIICKVKGAVNYHVEKILDMDDSETSVSKGFDNISGTKALNITSCDETMETGSSKPPSHEPVSTYPQVPEGSKSMQVEQTEQNQQPAGSWYHNQPNPPSQNIVITNRTVLGSTSQGVEIHLPEPNPKFANVPGSANVQESIQEKDRDDVSSPSASYLTSNVRQSHYIHDIPVDRSTHYANADQHRNSDSHIYSLLRQDKDREKLESYVTVTSPNLERPFLTVSDSIVSQYGQQSAEIAASHFDVLSVQRTEPTNKEPDTDTVTTPATPLAGSSNSLQSVSQSWPSMYAYYSHLASQFGMTLNDYPYMANINSSHQ